jgi:hypothetical protein
MVPATLVKIAAGCYLGSLGADFLPPCYRWLASLFLLTGIIANISVVALRYVEAWPMLPMYLGPVALPVVLGIIRISIHPSRDNHAITKATIGVLMVLIALGTIFFPKDFYVPFLKSQTLPAHLLFLFATVGKAFFLTGAAWALEALCCHKKHSPPGTDGFFYWNVWGFAFWTLSMFSGELWSYLGWGTPVVWDDPAITGIMATWFFYICLMHLHLTGTWSTRSRATYAAAGALVILVLNILPDLGPFRWPI